MNLKQAKKYLEVFDFKSMSIKGNIDYVIPFLESCDIGAKAIEKQDKMYDVIKMLSIKSKQNETILANDLYEILKNIFPEWNDLYE